MDLKTFDGSIEHDTLLYFSFQKDLENVAAGILFQCEEIIVLAVRKFFLPNFIVAIRFAIMTKAHSYDRVI